MPTGFAPGFAPGTSLGLVPGVDAMFAGLLQLAAGRPVFTADYYILDPVSGKVLAFVDWNDPTHLLIQTNSAFQVRPPQPHADFKGRLAVTFNAAEYYVSNRAASAWYYLHDGSDVHFTILGSPTNSTGSTWCGTRSAVLGLNFQYVAPGLRWRIDAGALNLQTTMAVGVPAYATAQITTSGASTDEIFVGGVSQATAVTAAQGLAGDGPLALGGNYTGGALSAFRWSLIYQAPWLSAQGLQSVREYIRAAYGIAP
jgi:hypothetical protein